jgi:hypothetical protein
MQVAVVVDLMPQLQWVIMVVLVVADTVKIQEKMVVLVAQTLVAVVAVVQVVQVVVVQVVVAVLVVQELLLSDTK